MALHADDIHAIDVRVEVIRARPQWRFLHAALTLLHENRVRLFRVASITERDHADFAGFDFHRGPFLDVIGVGIDAVRARPQGFVDHAAILRAVRLLVLHDELTRWRGLP